MVFHIRVHSGITPDADSSYCQNDAPVSASLGFPVRGTDGASQRDRCGLATCALNKIRPRQFGPRVCWRHRAKRPMVWRAACSSAVRLSLEYAKHMPPRPENRIRRFGSMTRARQSEAATVARIISAMATTDTPGLMCRQSIATFTALTPAQWQPCRR
jgi:hypothetical protein